MTPQWERVNCKWPNGEDFFPSGYEGLMRLPVPGGWLIMVYVTGQNAAPALTFYPDPQHQWKP